MQLLVLKQDSQRSCQGCLRLGRSVDVHRPCFQLSVVEHLEKLSFPRFQVHNRPVSSFRRRDFSYRIAVQNAFNTENDNTLACMLGKCGPFKVFCDGGAAGGGEFSM